MAGKTKTYNLAAIQFSVGGRKIGGFGADGGVTVTWNADLAEVVIGALGDAVANVSNDRGALVEVTVLESSKGYKDLAELQKAQLAELQDGGTYGRMEVRMNNPINGDTLRDQYGIFLNRPEMAMGKTAGERVFRIACPNAGANLDMGTANSA